MRSGVDPRTVLASARPGYQLNVPDVACDLGRFSIEKAAGVSDDGDGVSAGRTPLRLPEPVAA